MSNEPEEGNQAEEAKESAPINPADAIKESNREFIEQLHKRWHRDRIVVGLRVMSGGLFVEQSHLVDLLESYRTFFKERQSEGHDLSLPKAIRRLFETETPELKYLIDGKLCLLGHLLPVPLTNLSALRIPIFQGSLYDPAQYLNPRDPMLGQIPGVSPRLEPDGFALDVETSFGALRVSEAALREFARIYRHSPLLQKDFGAAKPTLREMLTPLVSVLRKSRAVKSKESGLVPIIAWRAAHPDRRPEQRRPDGGRSQGGRPDRGGSGQNRSADGRNQGGSRGQQGGREQRGRSEHRGLLEQRGPNQRSGQDRSQQNRGNDRGREGNRQERRGSGPLPAKMAAPLPLPVTATSNSAPRPLLFRRYRMLSLLFEPATATTPPKLVSCVELQGRNMEDWLISEVQQLRGQGPARSLGAFRFADKPTPSTLGTVNAKGDNLALSLRVLRSIALKGPHALLASKDRGIYTVKHCLEALGKLISQSERVELHQIAHNLPGDKVKDLQGAHAGITLQSAPGWVFVVRHRKQVESCVAKLRRVKGTATASGSTAANTSQRRDNRSAQPNQRNSGEGRERRGRNRNRGRNRGNRGQRAGAANQATAPESLASPVEQPTPKSEE